MFFAKFDKIVYDGVSIVDICNSFLLKYKPMHNTSLYSYHHVADGETPESIAFDYYKDASAHWVILLLNDVVDPFFGWVQSTPEITDMCKAMYGADRIDDVHHIVNIQSGYIVDEVEFNKYTDDGKIIRSLPVYYQAITNIEHHTTENDKRRNIKVLAPEYLRDFKTQFRDIFKAKSQ